MLDWLALGWNLAITMSGAFVVSLSVVDWPLRFDRRQAVIHTVLATLTGLLLAVYPHAILSASSAGQPAVPFGDLRFIPLVTLMLAYRPGWALLAAALINLPALLGAGALGVGPPDAARLAPALASAAVLLVTFLQKRKLGILNFQTREAALRLPMIFVCSGLPFLFLLGVHSGLLPMLLLTGFNLIGFLAGVTVLRSRFRLLAVSARLSRQAHTDLLTGLWNRRQLEHDLQRLQPGGHVLVVDLDYFKTINDRFGHDVGDTYLISAASAMNRALMRVPSRTPTPKASRRAHMPTGTGRAGLLAWASRLSAPSSPGPNVPSPRSPGPMAPLAYRMGGEEFALLVPDADPARAAELAQEVMRQIREVRHRVNPGGQLTCSIGAAQLQPGETPQQALRRADIALMHAKASGRDRAESAEQLVSQSLLTAQPPASGVESDMELSMELSMVPGAGLPGTVARPAQPLLWEAIHASLSLAALDRDLTTRDWTRLLQAAILSVPGAESGTINVRQGSRFVLCAQIGFDDALLSLAQSEEAQLEWYGLGRAAWTHGQPRVLHVAEIASRSNVPLPPDDDHAELYARHGRVDELRASLCIPVIMDGEVVGHLNLDRASDDRPFDGEDLRVARAFADQVTVLTVAARRRQALEEQRREQDWLLEFSLQLLGLKDADSVTACALLGLKQLYSLQGTVQPVTQPLPAAALGARAHLVLNLDWPTPSRPGAAGARLVVWRGSDFAPHERRVLEQTTRAVNAALGTLKVRETAGG